MKKLTRTKNTFRNVRWGLIFSIITIVGPFAVKTIIIEQLGTEYNGLSSLFSSILTLLNLSNLGFSSALVFTMYRAVAEEDNQTLSALLRFFRTAYRIVGLSIIVLGLILMPFLPHLVGHSYPSDINLYLLFGLYLAETALDYFMFSYTISLFQAHQRDDIVYKVRCGRYLLQYLLQGALLIIFKDFYFFLIASIALIIPTNLINLYLSKRDYPEIKCEGTLDDETKKAIFTRVWTLFGHKLGNTFLVSVDSVIISSFLGLKVLSLYSNYYYILTGVNALVQIVTMGILAGIGNKLITDSEEVNFRFFNVLTHGWLFIVGISGTLMLCLYQPFIAGIWLNEEYLFPTSIMVLLCIYFYAWMHRILQLTYRDAAGLWTKDWLKPYVAMVINLAGCIGMVSITRSVEGVLIPTTIVFFLIYTPWEAWAIFKYQFHQPLMPYLLKLLVYTVAIFSLAASCYLTVTWLFPTNSLVSFILRGILASLMFTAIWFISTCKLDTAKAFNRLIATSIKRRLAKTI